MKRLLPILLLVAGCSTNVEDGIRYHFANPSTVNVLECRKGTDDEGTSYVIGELTAENGMGATKNAFFIATLSEGGEVKDVVSAPHRPSTARQRVDLALIKEMAELIDARPSNLPD